MYVDILTVLLFFIVLILTKVLTDKKTNIPGPFALPLLGNVVFLFKIITIKNRHFFQELSYVYGNIFRIYYGPQMVVYICGYKSIYNALVTNGHEFLDRPNWIPGVTIGERNGILWGNGENWKKIRRVSLQAMRDFGVGKKSLEEIILEEVRNMDTVFDSAEVQKKGYVKKILTKASCNIIHNIIFGFRYQQNDEKLADLLDTLGQIFNAPSSVTKVIPNWLRNLVDNRVEKWKKCKDKVRDYVEEQVKEHKESFDANEIRDFVDIYLRAQDTNNKEEDIFIKGSFFQVIMDLFATGTETTGLALEWALLYMIGYPEAQQKCFEEIYAEVGFGRMVTLADTPKMKYVEAAVMEVQRLANVACKTLPRTVNRDVDLEGYLIPKGTIVYGILRSSHVDDGYWKDPFEFRPERFLDENGDLVKRDHLIPFSIGPRTCPGEALAKMEMFLVFSNLIQRFKFSKVDPSQKLSYVSVSGQSTGPSPYQLKATRRN